MIEESDLAYGHLPYTKMIFKLCDYFFPGSTSPPMWSTTGFFFSFGDDLKRWSQRNLYLFPTIRTGSTVSDPRSSRFFACDPFLYSNDGLFASSTVLAKDSSV